MSEDIAENLLWAEAKLGELLAARPKHVGRYGPTGGTIPVLPLGISKKISHYVQQLAKHPEAIEQVVAEAKEEDIEDTDEWDNSDDWSEFDNDEEPTDAEW